MKKSVMIVATALMLGFSTASAEPMCGNSCDMRGVGRGHGCGSAMMEERLGLNDKQIEKVEELQSNQFRKVSAERRKLVALERELHAESLKNPADNKKIDQLSEQIGKHSAALARLKSSHMTEVAALLTPAQLDSMRTMMDCKPGDASCDMKHK